MNYERLKVVRDAMAAAPEHKVAMQYVCAIPGSSRTPYEPRPYNTLLTDCKSVGCICGFTVACFPQAMTEAEKLAAQRNSDAIDAFPIGARILELSMAEAQYLFMGYWQPAKAQLREITKDEIIKHLDQLLSREHMQ